MIKTVDNFIVENHFFDGKNKKAKIANNYYFEYKNQNDIKNNLNITLKDFKQNSNNIFMSFREDKSKDDDLIIFFNSYQTNDNEKFYNIQIGNYIGQFTWEKVEIDIRSRFDDTFLKRMLNFANDVYLDDVDVTGKPNDKVDYSKFIIYYMFMQNLEKAFLLGLPKSYTTIKHHEIKVKGKVDINRFIKNDIPFKGRVSSVSREQKEIQEIVDVLYKAVKIIESNKFNIKNISHIKTHLAQYKSNRSVSNEVINRAMNSKALQNPIFAPYKKVLEYASYIINGNNLEQNRDGQNSTYGFLVNIAELFEIYVIKLLQKEFPDWSVTSPKIELYQDQFFGRKIIPDIVMQKENQILVFDTKYKKMEFRGTKNGVWDVDRTDFFQIHTYISYYQNQKDLNVIAGGLLYPIEKKFDKNICHSNNLFGNDKTKFVVDGIELFEAVTIENIVKQEKEFIGRMKKLMCMTQCCHDETA